VGASKGGEVMDIAAIWAKARELVNDANVSNVTESVFKRRIDVIEAALTQAYEQGWK